MDTGHDPRTTLYVVRGTWPKDIYIFYLFQSAQDKEYNFPMNRGLYIHIPFCKTRCHYCNFVSSADPTPQFRERFFNALMLEADEARRKYGELHFDTLYLGGGTPSLLNADEMSRLMETEKERFRIADGAEMTCEWNPGDGEEEKLAAFAGLGINRISLGVQSFQDPLLTRLGRRHSLKDILVTLGKIHDAGIHDISFDLMLRVPGQTVEDFKVSLQKCIELGADQVSLYDLEVHSGTVLGDLKENGRLDLPAEEDHAAMYAAAIEMLTRAGYEHYEISNFAKPGCASRHNLIYWHNQEYLGLGPGAFSYLGEARFQFARDVERYLNKCETRDWAPDQEDILSEEEKETETFLTGLRLRDGVRPADFKMILGVLEPRIQTLCKEGLMKQWKGNLRLTDRGKFLSEDVFGFLLRK